MKFLFRQLPEENKNLPASWCDMIQHLPKTGDKMFHLFLPGNAELLQTLIRAANNKPIVQN
jgi:hypothetical protein